MGENHSFRTGSGSYTSDARHTYVGCREYLGSMPFQRGSEGDRGQRLHHDILGVLGMMFVVALVVGALGLHVMV